MNVLRIRNIGNKTINGCIVFVCWGILQILENYSPRVLFTIVLYI